MQRGRRCSAPFTITTIPIYIVEPQKFNSNALRVMDVFMIPVILLPDRNTYLRLRVEKEGRLGELE